MYCFSSKKERAPLDAYISIDSVMGIQTNNIAESISNSHFKKGMYF